MGSTTTTTTYECLYNRTGETVGCHMIRVVDSGGSTLVEEWGRQQQQQRMSACTIVQERLLAAT